MELLTKEVSKKRINEVAELFGINIKQLAAKAGITYNSFQRYSSGTSMPTEQFFTGMYKAGVNLHWFVSGEGDILRDQQDGDAVNEAKAAYLKGCRGETLKAWIDEYMSSRTADECVWLDVEMMRRFEDYKGFKVGRK